MEISIEKKQKFEIKFRIILIVMLLIALIFFFYMFHIYGLEGIQCQKNPLVYGANNIAESQSNGHMSCTCSISGDEYSKNYYFDENGFKDTHSGIKFDMHKINVSIK